MMFFLLVYCVLLLLYLVGLVVCGCSKILQMYVCMMIDGGEFLISGVDSDLIFLAVVICPKIVGRSFNLQFIVPL